MISISLRPRVERHSNTSPVRRATERPGSWYNPAVPEKRSDKTDLGEFLLNAQSDLGHGMAFLDPKTGRIIKSNAAFHATFGFTDRELPSLPSFASLFPTDSQGQIREHLRAYETRPTFETTGISKAGQRLWLEISLRPLKIGMSTVVTAMVSDITRRREVEEQVLLLETITLAVNDAPSFQTALGMVLRKVCVATGWQFGLAWVPSLDRRALTVGTGSYGAGAGLERFRTAMTGIELAQGDDLPGRAWLTRQPQWVDDVSLLRSFRRQTILREFGVRASMAIPVVVRDEVVAVLEFCVSDRQAFAKDFFLGLASAIAPQLGSLFQRKKAEHERDRFFSLSPDLMCVAGFDDFFKRVNPAFETILGYSAAELVSRPVSEFIHPDDRQKTLDLGAELARVGQTTSFENRYIAKDGSVKWILWGAIMDRDDSVVYAIGRDITQRKVRDEQLRETNVFLDSVVENIPDMIFIKDAKDLRFVRFNRAGEKLLGVERSELIGRNDYDLFPKDEADFFISKDREVLREGKLVEIAEEVIHTKGGVKTLHTKKIPILDADGKPVFLLGISEEITPGRKPA